MRSLNHAYGSFLTRCSSAEYQYGFRQKAGDNALVVDLIVTELLDRAANERLLSFQFSNWRRVFPRQPGEGRNLRMNRSVWNQNLLPLTVIDESLRFSKLQADLAHRRAANGAQRR